MSEAGEVRRRTWMGRVSQWFLSHLPSARRREAALEHQAQRRHDLVQDANAAAYHVGLQMLELRRAHHAFNAGQLKKTDDRDDVNAGRPLDA